MGVAINHQVPAFSLPAIERHDLTERTLARADYAGTWLVLLFYPRDFSFVCPTELIAFSARIQEFQHRSCQLVGVSADSVAIHREWLTTPPSEGGLGPLQFPLASDPEGNLSRDFGVWDEQKHVAHRGLFVIDPEGRLQYAVVHNLNVGRSPAEVLRVIDALQSGGLCPANWTNADGTFDPESVLKPGQVLGRYRIHRLIGDGTFGSVFAARDLRLKRDVALKVLKRDLASSRVAVLAEARSAARLTHPNVCTIYAVDEEDDLPVIVMEYLPGRNLADVLSEPLSAATARSLAGQIALGLAAAHAQHVVHGDLKPANVIVLPDNVIKILDFGLARTYRATTVASKAPLHPAPLPPIGSEFPDDEDETLILSPSEKSVLSDEFDSHDLEETLLENDGRAFGLTGTPAYVSPEQSQGHSATPESDVFSLGLILFEMLTGQRGLPENNLIALLSHLQSEDLAEELASQVEAEFQTLLADVLATNPAQRPSMQTIAERLQAP